MELHRLGQVLYFQAQMQIYQDVGIPFTGLTPICCGINP